MGFCKRLSFRGDIEAELRRVTVDSFLELLLAIKNVSQIEL